MGNICPANKGVDGSGTAYKSSGTSNREQVYKLSIQKGGHENVNSAGGYPAAMVNALSSASTVAAANVGPNSHHLINGNIYTVR